MSSLADVRHRQFVLFVVVFAFASLAATSVLHGSWPLLAGFDVAAIAFAVSVSVTMRGASVASMRERAARDDAGRILLIAITAISLGIVLGALAIETRAESALPLAVPAALGTLVLAWVFGNLVFALQYAHRFYQRVDGGDRAGLCFPDDDTPNYADFCYFSFVVGMTFQVSDVTIAERGMRRLCLAHALIAFFFNLGVVALSVNILAGTG